jgi:hypothetical protein
VARSLALGAFSEEALDRYTLYIGRPRRDFSGKFKKMIQAAQFVYK